VIVLDFLAIGKKIKELRKVLRLSQQDLANGICTQAQISKIEKGDVYPYATTLYLISQKLGVDVNYFFDIGKTPRIDYVQEVGRQLKIARRNLDYRTILEIVKTEEKNPLFTQNRVNLQELLWHKGICEYMLNHDLETALCLFDEAISLTFEKVWSEKEIEILLAKGAIYFEEKRYDEALKVYLQAKEQLELLHHLQDETIMTRLLYSISTTYTRLGRFEDSTTKCKKAISWCLKQDTLYLLGELHYQIGYNFELQRHYDRAKAFMEKALIIFELQSDVKYMQFIRNKICQWG
jgi:transcriptional regulator with XRE-family HTH domain